MESMANPYAGVGIIAVILGFILMMVLVSVVVGAVICYFVFTLYKAVPAQFRQAAYPGFQLCVEFLRVPQALQVL